MTMNKTWLAAIAIALASSTQVQAWGHWDWGPGPFAMCHPEAGHCRNLEGAVSERTIDEALQLLESIFHGSAHRFSIRIILVK